MSDRTDPAGTNRGNRAVMAANDEAKRIDKVRARAAVPEDCGPEIPEAPARGLFRTVHLNSLYPNGAGEFVAKPAGFQGRKTMLVADVFDRMFYQAGKRGTTFGLTKRQIEAGRLYARLVERHEAGGVKCSSLESAAVRGGGSGAGVSEARLAESRQIAAMERRIGNGMALELRRVRASSRSRSAISDRQLVFAVCREGKTPSEVLEKHGWAQDTKTRHVLTRALGAALDRMAGPLARGGIRTMRTDQPPSVWEP